MDIRGDEWDGGLGPTFFRDAVRGPHLRVSHSFCNNLLKSLVITPQGGQLAAHRHMWADKSFLSGPRSGSSSATLVYMKNLTYIWYIFVGFFVQCIFVQGALSSEALLGKNTTEFYWRRGFFFFSYELNEDGRSFTAVTLNHGQSCWTDAIATSTTTERNEGSGTTIQRPGWSSRTTVLIASRGSHDGCASTLCEAPSTVPGPATCNQSGDRYSKFCTLLFYIGAVDGLLVEVPRLLES